MNDTPKMTDNSAPTREMLAYLERVERLEEEKAALSSDISDIWNEAKSKGFDTKALRKVYALRKLDADARAMIGLYADKLGLFE